MPALPFLIFVLALLAAPATAAPADVMALVRAGSWADAAAAAEGDPLAAKLVTYYRLQAAGAARAAEIGAFLAANPDWPGAALLTRRREEALAADPDDVASHAECDRLLPVGAPALLHCAQVYRRAGLAALATTAARRAWVGGVADPAAETGFLAAFGPVLTREDQWRRFDRLAWGTDIASAMRQLGRLDPADRPRAEARLALRRDDPAAAALVEALPVAQRGEPAIFLEHARWLRRGGHEPEAMALWISGGAAAEKGAPPDRVAAFWVERDLLARRRLRAFDNAGAEALAAGHGQAGVDQAADAEFLAGFVALRLLNDPVAAMPHFERLAGLSKAVITQGRAHYWLGRTAEAAGDAARARDEYIAAGVYPTSYYGQLALLRLGVELPPAILALRDPPENAALAGRELARAATWLVGAGERRRAQPFLARLDDTAAPTDRGTVARLANGLDMPESVVAVARRAGRDGIMLAELGWPTPVEVPPDAGVEPALALAVMRQESSFDPSVISPAGARGLMQLMPATAAELGKRLGLPVTMTALTDDPALNMRLGTSYLRQLTDRYGDAVPLIAAGYNAGPGRVAEWLGVNGDPRAGADVVDWIELIPNAETRNYVQRVIENLAIYRARRGDNAAHPLAQWLH
jgi:soluble lytic murein transglycosylase